MVFTDEKARYLLLVLGGLEEVAAADVRSHLSAVDADAAVTVVSPCEWRDDNGAAIPVREKQHPLNMLSADTRAHHLACLMHPGSILWKSRESVGTSV